MDTPWLIDWIILPLLIIISRITDISLGTLRIIYLAKGKRVIVPILGFFKVLIWLVAISQVMQNLTNVFYYLAYATGFALGNYLGIVIEEKLAIGKLIFRIVTRYDCENLIHKLRENKFRVTVIDAEGDSGPVKIIFTVIKRKNKQKVIQYIKDNNPHAFFTIDEVKAAGDVDIELSGIDHKNRYHRLLFKRRRKGK